MRYRNDKAIIRFGIATHRLMLYVIHIREGSPNFKLEDVRLMRL
jgi:hypothetical protein